MRTSILGMASHDLINPKPTILGATLGAIPGMAANPPERFSICPCILGVFFQELGWSPRNRMTHKLNIIKDKKTKDQQKMRVSSAIGCCFAPPSG